MRYRTNQAERVAAAQAKHEALTMEYERARMRERAEQGRRNAIVNVCNAMAQSNLIGSVFVKDAKMAAKMGGDAMRWQANALLAQVGAPLMLGEE